MKQGAKFFIGTSGWSYSWNPDGFDWYAENSGLNAVELNSSFYRFPFPSYVKHWAKKGKDLAWAVKVTRWITHRKKFNQCIELWNRFHLLFKPLEESIHYYLFQLPPSTTPKAIPKIQEFFEKTKLIETGLIALEPRNTEWFTQECFKWAKQNNITFVSVDAPKLPRNVIKTTKNVYLRFHGRTSWYSYDYSKEELREKAEQIKKTKPRNAYIFFNNDHAMLENARVMKRLL